MSATRVTEVSNDGVVWMQVKEPFDATAYRHIRERPVKPAGAAMNDEVKVGDRFRWAPHNSPTETIATVTQLDEDGGVHWTLEGPGPEKFGHNQRAEFLLLSCWRRLPREEAKPGAIVEVDGTPEMIQAVSRFTDMIDQQTRQALDNWVTQNPQAFTTPGSNQPGAYEQLWTQGSTDWRYNIGIDWGVGEKPPKAEPVCNEAQCDYHHDKSDPACVRAKHRGVRKPFRYHQRCDKKHAPFTSMCLACETLWQADTEAHDRDIGEHRYVTAKPIAREPYEPLHGAFVGRVLTPVGR